MTGEIALMIPIIALTIPVVAIWTKHAQRMAEIKASMGQTVSPNVSRELAEIKQQISELRDTTTRFDMSFDAAITHLENRMDSMEANQTVATPLPPRATTSPASGEEQILLGKNR